MGRRRSVNDAYEALARFVVRFRWPIVVFWVLVVVVTTAALPTLGSQVNDNNSAFLRSSAPSSKAANLAAPLLGGGAGKIAAVTVVASRNGPLSTADIAAVQREAQLALRVEKVQSVRALGISADREAVAVRVRVALSANDIDKDTSIINSLQSTIA